MFCGLDQPPRSVSYATLRQSDRSNQPSLHRTIIRVAPTSQRNKNPIASTMGPVLLQAGKIKPFSSLMSVSSNLFCGACGEVRARFEDTPAMHAGNGFCRMLSHAYGESTARVAHVHCDGISKVLMSRMDSSQWRSFTDAARRSNIFKSYGCGGGSRNGILPVPVSHDR
jgi:hypothetical protein